MKIWLFIILFVQLSSTTFAQNLDVERIKAQATARANATAARSKAAVGAILARSSAALDRMGAAKRAAYATTPPKADYARVDRHKVDLFYDELAILNGAHSKELQEAIAARTKRYNADLAKFEAIREQMDVQVYSDSRMYHIEQACPWCRDDHIFEWLSTVERNGRSTLACPLCQPETLQNLDYSQMVWPGTLANAIAEVDTSVKPVSDGTWSFGSAVYLGRIKAPYRKYDVFFALPSGDEYEMAWLPYSSLERPEQIKIAELDKKRKQQP